MNVAKKITLVSVLLLSGLIAGCNHIASPPSTSLDEKLASEYRRYEKAQQYVMERYRDPTAPLEQQWIARDAWETMLAPASGEAFSADDLNELKTRQRRQIAASRQAAIAASRVDFSKWRALPANQAQQHVRAFCKAVPKGGMLHIHPWGSLDRHTFGKLLARSNPEVPVETLLRNLSDPQGLAYLYPEELAWLKTLPAKVRFNDLPQANQERLVHMGLLPPGAHSFERFEAAFNFVALVMIGDWDNVTTAYEDFAQRAVRAGVQYVEFTEAIAPQDVPHYEKLANRLEKKYGLTVRFNVAYFRTRSAASQHEAVMAMLKQTDSPIIVGIDLLASELNAPALETGQAVYGPVMAANARRYQDSDKRWRRTMHAGEHGDPRNPRDAILLGAERLGHGVRLIENPVVMQYAANQRIPVEINLISNLKLRALDDIRQHPYLTYLRLGMPVSLSTDDEGIYSTTINDECELAVGKTDVSYYEFKEMAFNSIRTSFAPEAVKQHMLRDLTKRFARFERTLRPN